MKLYSIGKKVIMALTGMFLILFLIEHLSGNLLLLARDHGLSFNAYANFMGHNIFIRIAEVVLMIGFIFHIADGFYLATKNKAARPESYRKRVPTPGSSWFSRNMIWTGSIIFIYLVLHLSNFWLIARFGIGADLGLDKNGNENLYQHVIEVFSFWWYPIIYIVAMTLLAMHLLHGFSSAFQTLGLRHKSYFGFIQKLGIAYAIIVPVLFAMIPIIIYFSQS